MVSPPQSDLDDQAMPDASDDDASSSAGSEPVETLVAGRSKRATAGNRMAHLIGQEEQQGPEDDGVGGDDDDVALLFAETGEEDVEFEDPDAEELSAEGGDDDEDDSSTDDEDRGPGAGDDELEGEKQLQKEERAAKKLQKRKAMARPLAVRKRVKIDDSATASMQGESEAAGARPRKKSERISWMPATGDAPKRTSSRTLSVQNKQRTMASMKESDARRAQIIKNMEFASQKKKKERARPMTQRERLEEAARVEEVNTKSLTHWEEMEKERLERQRAKIEAMQNRVLEGPVIRWYTGPAEKIGGKITMLGSRSVVKEIITSQNDADPPKERKYQRKNKKPKEVPPADSVTGPGESDPALADGKVPASEPAAAQGTDIGADSATPVVSTEPTREDPNTTDKDGKPNESTNTDEPPPAQDLATISGAETTEVVPGDEKQAEEANKVAFDQSDTDVIMDEPAKESANDPAQEQNSTPQETGPTSTAVSPPDAVPERTTVPSSTAANEASSIKDDPPAMQEASAGTEQSASKDGPSHVEEAAPSANDLSTTAPTPSEQITEQAAEHTTAEPGPQVESEELQSKQVEPETQTVDALAPPPPEPIKTSQQTVTLLEFSENALNSLDASRRILFSAPPSIDANAPPPLPLDAFVRPPKPVPQTCIITCAPARYRDPSTGLPYADRTAYAMIKRVLKGECRWSNLLGAWVGADVELTDGVEKDVSNGQDVAMVGIGGTRAARGVPLGFLDAAAVPRPVPQDSTATKTADSASNQEDAVKIEAGAAGLSTPTPTATTSVQ